MAGYFSCFFVRVAAWKVGQVHWKEMASINVKCTHFIVNWQKHQFVMLVYELLCCHWNMCILWCFEQKCCLRESSVFLC